MKEEITLKELRQASSAQALLGLPDEIESFLHDIYSTKFSAFSTEDGEEAIIVKEVRALVRKICQKVAEYDSRFEMSIFPTGSTVEGTKVWSPDEFDFVLCLRKIEELVEIVKSVDSLKTGFACLQFKEKMIPTEYLPFADWDGCFVPYPYLKYLFHYLDRALNETDLWVGGSFYCSFENQLRCIHKKPVFNFTISWVGPKHKHLDISIDLVPGVYKKGWWPKDARSFVDKLPLMNKDIKDAGCFLLLQSPNSEPDIVGIKHMDDSTNYAKADKKIGRWKMLRISAAPAEICLMKSLTELYKKCYRLGKVFKSVGCFPNVRLDEPPLQGLSQHTTFKDYDFKKNVVSPNKLIKSYMLKKCIFYVAQQFQIMGKVDGADSSSVHIMMKHMFMHLLERSDERIFRPYFLPYSDVFEFISMKTLSSIRLNIMFYINRELAIRYLLDILGLDVRPLGRMFYLPSRSLMWTHSNKPEFNQNTIEKLHNLGWLQSPNQ